MQKIFILKLCDFKKREDAERKTDLINNKLTELAGQVSSITGVAITNNVEGLVLLIKSITKIVDESTMMKGKLMTTTNRFILYYIKS